MSENLKSEQNSTIQSSKSKGNEKKKNKNADSDRITSKDIDSPSHSRHRGFIELRMNRKEQKQHNNNSRSGSGSGPGSRQQAATEIVSPVHIAARGDGILLDQKSHFLSTRRLNNNLIDSARAHDTSATLNIGFAARKRPTFPSSSFGPNSAMPMPPL